MVGRTYGQLTVIAEDARRKGKTAWRCRCSCGRIQRSVPGDQLRIGDRTRCKSCALKLKVETTVRVSTKHGANRRGARSSEYTSWVEMRARCLNQNHPRFNDWGGRGITVHPEWVTSFEAFYAHIGPKPSRKHTIDRIENDVGYVPGNVRWATVLEQNRNNRRVWRIPIDGQVFLAVDLAKYLGVDARRLRYWLGDGRNGKTGDELVQHLETSIIRAMGVLEGGKMIERLRKVGAIETRPQKQLRAK